MRNRRRDREDGAAAVELALVTPLLVMFVFGIVAFGVVFAQQLALGNAARQAARYGVVADRTCAQLVTEARNAATGIAMRSQDARVSVRVGSTRATATSRCATPTSTSVPCEGSTVGDNVYVSVDYTSRLVVPLVVAEPTFDLRGEGAFRCEFS
jgi:Flp pilus assembly protein TadG